MDNRETMTDERAAEICKSAPIEDFAFALLEICRLRELDKVICATRDTLHQTRGINPNHPRHERQVVSETLRTVASRLFDHTNATISSHQTQTEDGRQEVTFSITVAEKQPRVPGEKRRYHVGRPGADSWPEMK